MMTNVIKEFVKKDIQENVNILQILEIVNLEPIVLLLTRIMENENGKVGAEN